MFRAKRFVLTGSPAHLVSEVGDKCILAGQGCWRTEPRAGAPAHTVCPVAPAPGLRFSDQRLDSRCAVKTRLIGLELARQKLFHDYV